jgi:hypothetical protein
MKRLILIVYIAITAQNLFSQNECAFQIARLKYEGGGDWYNGQTEEPNVLDFVRQNTNIKVKAEYTWVDVSSDAIFSYPFIFSKDEADRLRKYCEAGGFLFADDDYGMDKAFRREILKIFPDEQLLELPFNYPMYNDMYNFPNGVPKTHYHNGKPPQGFGIFIKGRLAVYYTYESNPSDGWDDADVHGDPPDKRLEALRFGVNLIVWALSN